MNDRDLYAAVEARLQERLGAQYRPGQIEFALIGLRLGLEMVTAQATWGVCTEQAVEIVDIKAFDAVAETAEKL